MASQRARRLAIVGGVLAAGLVTGAVLARRHRRPDVVEEPWPELPEGHPLVVPTTGGAHLAASVAGPADGPTVVLAHCWTGLRAFWASVARDLVDDGHRVVVYDQRGHGQSSLGDSPVSIADLGHDLHAVLEAVGAHDAVLVGHSMGGMTIQSYAAEHPLDFEQRIRGVVLVATAARSAARAPAAIVERLMGEGRAEWTRRGSVGRRMVRGALGENASPSHVDLTLEGFAAAAGAARAGYLVAMMAMDLREAGSVIGQVPTRILVGTRDTLTPVRQARELEQGIPGAELEIIPGAGHMLPLEQPARIVAAVRELAARPAAVSAR
jgi:non-heme chloroperoxidase